jgi:hypothetical protein
VGGVLRGAADRAGLTAASVGVRLLLGEAIETDVEPPRRAASRPVTRDEQHSRDDRG